MALLLGFAAPLEEVVSGIGEKDGEEAAGRIVVFEIFSSNGLGGGIWR